MEVLRCPSCNAIIGVVEGDQPMPGFESLKRYDSEWRGMDIVETCKCGVQVTSSTILVAIQKG